MTTLEVKWTNGAEILRKSIFQLIDKTQSSLLKDIDSVGTISVAAGVSIPIEIQKTKNLLKISKHSSNTESSKSDFTITVKLLPTTKGIEWWPLSLISSDGQVIHAEKQIKGKSFINAHDQNELIGLANSWGKSIAAQALSRSVENVLIR